MLIKVKQYGKNFRLFDPFIGPLATVNQSSWEIIKAVKKFGFEEAINSISKLYNLDKNSAKDDIKTVLENLHGMNISVEDISLKISKEIYSPRSVEFVITPKCNCRCIYCQSSWTRGSEIELSTEQIKNVLNDLSNIGTWCVWLECGGVLLREDIFEILGYAEKLEIAVVIFISGALVNDETAKKLSSFKNLRVQVDLDSYNPKHQDLHRGLPGDFEKTISGIKSLMKNNITPQIAMIVTKHNLNDIEGTADFVYNLGIKYFFLGPTGYFYGSAYENKDDLCLNRSEIKKLKENLMKVQKKYKDEMVIALST